MPRLTSGWPNTAFSDATTKSHASASSQPPPSAKPFTSAITGNGAISSARSVSWPLSAKSRIASIGIALIAAMSAPATKARSPPPVTSRQRAPASASTTRVAAAMSSSTCGDSALSAFGRLMVSSQMPGSRCSRTTVSYVISLLRVIVEPAACLAAEVPGRDHLLQQRRRAVLGIAEVGVRTRSSPRAARRGRSCRTARAGRSGGCSRASCRCRCRRAWRDLPAARTPLR